MALKFQVDIDSNMKLFEKELNLAAKDAKNLSENIKLVGKSFDTSEKSMSALEHIINNISNSMRYGFREQVGNVVTDTKELNNLYKGTLQQIIRMKDSLKSLQSGDVSGLSSLSDNLTGLKQNYTQLLEKLKQMRSETDKQSVKYNELTADIGAIEGLLKNINAFQTRTTKLVQDAAQYYNTEAEVIKNRNKLEQEETEELERQNKLRAQALVQARKEEDQQIAANKKSGYKIDQSLLDEYGFGNLKQDTDDLNELINTLSMFGGSAGKSVASTLRTLSTQFEGLGETLSGVIKLAPYLAGVFATLSALFLGFKTYVKMSEDGLKKFTSSIKVLGNFLSKIFYPALSLVSSGIKKAFSGLGNIIKSAFSSGISQLNSFVKQLNPLTNLVNVLSNAFNSLKSTIAGAFDISSFANYVKDAVTTASDLVEVQNVVDTVFKNMSDSIYEFTENSRRYFGLGLIQSRQYIGYFGSMLKSSGIKEQFVEMSENLTKLSADLASFYNMDYDDAFEKLKSGLAGNVMPLRKLGIDLTKTSLQQYLLKKGFVDSEEAAKKFYSGLDQSQRMMLRYNYILEATRDAQLDFNKTQSSWANQIRLLHIRLKDLATLIGGFWQKTLYPVLVGVNNLLDSAIRRLERVASMLGFDMQALQEQQGLVDAERGNEIDYLHDEIDAQDELNEKRKEGLANVHQLNVIASKSSSADATKQQIDDLEKYKDLAENLQNDVDDILSKFNLDKIGEMLANKFNNIIDSIDFNKLGEFIGSGLEWLGSQINDFFDTFDFDNLGYKFSELLLGVISKFSPETAGHLLVNKFNAIFEFLRGFLSNAELRDKLSAWITETINAAFKNLDINAFASTMRFTGRNLGTLIRTMIIGDENGETEGLDFSLIISKIRTGIIGIFDGIQSAFDELGLDEFRDKYVSKFNTIFTEIFNPVTFVEAADTINAAIDTILKTITIAFDSYDFSNAGASLAEFPRRIIFYFASNKNLVQESIVDFFSIIGDTIYGFVNNIPWNTAGEVVGTFITSILDGFSVLMERLADADIGTKLGSFVNGIFEDFKPESFGAAVSSFINTILLTIVNFISTTNWSEIGTKLGQALQSTFDGINWTDITIAIETFFNSLPDLIGNFLNNVDMVGAANELGSALKRAFDNINWDEVEEAVDNLVTEITNAIKEFFESSDATAIGQKLGELAGKFLEIGKEIALQWLATKIDFIFGYLKQAIKNIGSDLLDFASNLFNTLISNFFTYIGNVIGAKIVVIVTILNTLKTGFEIVWNAIKTVIESIDWQGIFDSIKNIISSAIEGIKSILAEFKTGWDNFWNGLAGVVTSVLSPMKEAINSITKLIDNVVKSINSLTKVKIGDWIGKAASAVEKYFDKTEKAQSKSGRSGYIRVPAHAAGAVIPPNQPYLAILGDQKKGTNIETPLDTMIDAFKTALYEMDFNGGSGVGDITIPIYVDNQLTSQELIKKERIARYRSNGK